MNDDIFNEVVTKDRPDPLLDQIILGRKLRTLRAGEITEARLLMDPSESLAFDTGHVTSERALVIERLVVVGQRPAEIMARIGKTRAATKGSIEDGEIAGLMCDIPDNGGRRQRGEVNRRVPVLEHHEAQDEH